MYVQKILILFIFLVSTVFSNVQEISAAGNSAGSQKPLRFYENRGGDFELTGPDGKELLQLTNLLHCGCFTLFLKLFQKN